MRIEKEDIDVIEDEAAPAPKHIRKGRRASPAASKPDSTNGSKALHLSTNTVGDTPVGRTHSFQAAHCTTTVSQDHATKLPDPAGFNARVRSTCSNSFVDGKPYDSGDHVLEDGDLMSLLETTAGILSQIDDMKRKEDMAEQDYIRNKLDEALIEKARLQIALDDCKSEINKLRDKDMEITARMQNISSRREEDETDEERKIHDEAMKAIQRLHDIRSQKLETRKRRVSQWSTSSSPPTREAKRSR